MCCFMRPSRFQHVGSFIKESLNFADKLVRVILFYDLLDALFLGKKGKVSLIEQDCMRGSFPLEANIK